MDLWYTCTTVFERKDCLGVRIPHKNVDIPYRLVSQCGYSPNTRKLDSHANHARDNLLPPLAVDIDFMRGGIAIDDKLEFMPLEHLAEHACNVARECTEIHARKCRKTRLGLEIAHIDKHAYECPEAFDITPHD